MTARNRIYLCWLFALIPTGLQGTVPNASKPASVPSDEWRQVHDPDGTGKFFLGREIAQVMGHQAADWLDRPEREEEERPSLLIDSLKLASGDQVADIGAGSGYISKRLARKVGEQGRVYAVDVQKEMLALLSQRMAWKRSPTFSLCSGRLRMPRCRRRAWTWRSWWSCTTSFLIRTR